MEDKDKRKACGVCKKSTQTKADRNHYAEHKYIYKERRMSTRGKRADDFSSFPISNTAFLLLNGKNVLSGQEVLVFRGENGATQRHT